jgi:hypothetical protein
LTESSQYSYMLKTQVVVGEGWAVVDVGDGEVEVLGGGVVLVEWLLEGDVVVELDLDVVPCDGVLVLVCCEGL